MWDYFLQQVQDTVLGGGYIVPVTTRYKILRRFLLASSDNPNLYLWYLIYAHVLIKFPLYSL